MQSIVIAGMGRGGRLARCWHECYPRPPQRAYNCLMTSSRVHPRPQNRVLTAFVCVRAIAHTHRCGTPASGIEPSRVHDLERLSAVLFLSRETGRGTREAVEGAAAPLRRGTAAP